MFKSAWLWLFFPREKFERFIRMSYLWDRLGAFCVTDKKMSGKSKDEQIAEKKQELEKRLLDVTGQLGSTKKPTKKGELFVKGLSTFKFDCDLCKFG